MMTMKVLSKDQAHTFQNSTYCIAYEYPLGDTDINGAVIELRGRYPEKGRTVNEICKEIAYVVKGKGKVTIDDVVSEISEGSVVLIHPGEKFFWEGDLVMFMPCTPAWYPQQHKEVD
jgi:mannose-6-phosphate isomerase-like protein (cupin superfamily)